MKIDRTGTRLFRGTPLACVGETEFWRAWGDAENDFPRHFKRALARMGWKDLSLVIAFSDYEVPVQGQRVKLDLFALARSGEELVALAVAGSMPPNVPGVDPSLLGRPIENPHLPLAAALLLEADRFGLSQALLLTHAFGNENAWRESFDAFSEALGNPVSIGLFRLQLGWIQAEADYPKP